MAYKTKHSDRVFLVARYSDRRWFVDGADEGSLLDPKYKDAVFLSSITAKNEASALSIAKIKYRSGSPTAQVKQRKGSRLNIRVSVEGLERWGAAASTAGMSLPAWISLVADRAATLQEGDS